MAQVTTLDLHCYTNFGLGSDSILKLYNSALKKEIPALVLTDIFPSSDPSKISYYETLDFLVDLEDLKDHGWKQKIPIIVGIEYKWPEWLMGGKQVSTLIFGTQAIHQILELEKYRKRDGYDKDGNIFIRSYAPRNIINLNIEGRTDFRLIVGEGEKDLIQRFNEEKSRWVYTDLDASEIKEEWRVEGFVGQVLVKSYTGENLIDIWSKFQLALTYQLEDFNEIEDLSKLNPIESAVILCSPDPSYLNEDGENYLPKQFLDLIDGIEISYYGQAKLENNLNYSEVALKFAEKNKKIGLINTHAYSAALYGSIRNEFKGLINSESELINFILDQKVTKSHLKNLELFCKTAKEVLGPEIY